MRNLYRSLLICLLIFGAVVSATGHAFARTGHVFAALSSAPRSPVAMVAGSACNSNDMAETCVHAHSGTMTGQTITGHTMMNQAMMAECEDGQQPHKGSDCRFGNCAIDCHFLPAAATVTLWKPQAPEYSSLHLNVPDEISCDYMRPPKAV